MLSLILALAPIAPLPPQNVAAERLEHSPRHHEWIDVERGERTVRAFAVFPERADKAPVVLVIHENKGLTDWVRSVCDRLAEEGFVAVAPDLLSGAGPEGGNTESFASNDDATKALYARDAAEVMADLDAVADAALKLDAADSKLFVAGFCWGGTQSFAFATRRADLKAAFVFYGSAPTDAEALERIGCPVYGFYGENDARIAAGLPATEEAMQQAGKTFEPVVYAGAGHGFLRAGESTDASEANRKAREEAWSLWLGILGGN
ncbi:MAG TPA: dienelactone hydrolase family protein [Planctomycetota bacterium]|nr:dienelactone hydrolase family protein [Planctomycetota bacterium]